MKHVIISIIGLFLFLLGLFMAASIWGWVLMAVPVIYWILMFMILIHKSLFAAIVFWSAVAYIQWQVALVAVMAFILFVGIRSVYRDHAAYSAYYGGVNKTRTRKSRTRKFNPATGLPMMGNVDTDGNPYGSDMSSDDDPDIYMDDIYICR